MIRQVRYRNSPYCVISTCYLSTSNLRLRTLTVYIELHCASAFSFLQGASLPETLVERAAALGYPALALLDADGVYGAPRFHKAARKAGLKAIIGAELTIAPFHNPERTTQRNDPHRPQRRGAQRINKNLRVSVTQWPVTGSDCWQLPVLVESQEGYRNLCRLVTRMKMRGLLDESPSAHAWMREERRRAGSRGARGVDHRPRGARRPRGYSTASATVSAGCWIVSSGSSDAVTCASNCNVICCETTRPRTWRWRRSHGRFVCRWLRPTGYGSPSQPSARCSTY